MSAAGTWNIKIPMVGKDFILILNSAGSGKLSGTMVEKGGNKPEAIKNGTETGNKVHWEVATPFNSKFDGDINGTKMTGTVQAPLGSAPFEGTRG